MKVLFNCPLPFSLAHGGAQIQIEQTKAALEAIGVEVEWMRWWDEAQTGDVLHHFARPAPFFVSLAQAKGWRVVVSELLTEQGSRPAWAHWLHKIGLTLFEHLMPRPFASAISSRAMRMADACVALTKWEAHLMSHVYGVAPECVHVVPNGVEDTFLAPIGSRERSRWLVCTATITERKRVLELARAAVAAQAPTWIIGRPYSEGDPYAVEFVRVARENPEWVRFEGAIADRERLAEVYREARGFVLLSAMESLSLSALEAAACGCPLLLSDLPWATGSFGSHAQYCPIAGTAATSEALRRFYESAPRLAPPPRPLSWHEVAVQLRALYERLCSTSR